MGWCCGLFGSSRRSTPAQPPVAARPAQTGLEGVEFSPRHSFASSNGRGHRPAQNGLEGVEFSPSHSFASSDGEGTHPGAVARSTQAAYSEPPAAVATVRDVVPQNPELLGTTRRRLGHMSPEGSTNHKRQRRHRHWPDFLLIVGGKDHDTQERVGGLCIAVVG
ncbi:hypothetical protein PG990_011406 [Apiospora arundinis]